MTSLDTQISTELGAEPARLSPYRLATDALAHISEMLIVLFDWQYRARQRRQLLGLSDAALKDFGAGRTDAAAEGDKPFWQS